jgi:hypothetical protein
MWQSKREIYRECNDIIGSAKGSQISELASFKKYMPPLLPYFKVNTCPFPLPHFASIFFAYL